MRFTRIGFPMPDLIAHFRRRRRDYLRAFRPRRTVDQAREHPAADRDPDRDRDDQDSGAVPSQPGLLVHGERRADRLCNDDELAFSDQRRRRLMVS